MKTTILFLLAIGAAFCIASCLEKDDFSPAHVDYGSYAKYQKINLHADVSKSDTHLEFYNDSEFEFGGNAKSCNLLDEACFYIYGLMDELDKSGNFNFNKGELEITSRTSGCTLFGKFDGTGRVTGDTFNFNAEVQVECGSGKLKSSGGTLTLSIHGVLPSEAEPYLSYKVDLEGILNK